MEISDAKADERKSPISDCRTTPIKDTKLTVGELTCKP